MHSATKFLKHFFFCLFLDCLFAAAVVVNQVFGNLANFWNFEKGKHVTFFCVFSVSECILYLVKLYWAFPSILQAELVPMNGETRPLVTDQPVEFEK